MSSDRKIVAWMQLLRLPNVFTAVADVMMGYLVTRHELEPASHIGLLILASCLLYLSGMVLNDVYDAQVDAREQPDRPIPSGRVSLQAAKVVGWGLLVAGVAAAWILSWQFANDWRPGAIATILAACIVMYDCALKRTRSAPLLMGECRFLNVLLGMSLSFLLWGKFELLIAAGIGIYTTGVTLFARTDAHVSSRHRLISGIVVLLIGLAVLAATPQLTNNRPPLKLANPFGWYLLWIAIGLIIARRCVTAIYEPVPSRVQAAVRHCVQSLIVLDAAMCVGYSPWFSLLGFAAPWWAFAILSLLIPTLLLTLWLNAT